MIITVASPALILLPSLQNAVLGAGLGLWSQTSTPRYRILKAGRP